VPGLPHHRNRPSCPPVIVVGYSFCGVWGDVVLRYIVIIACAALLVGCATKYQDMGFTGGVAAEPVMTDVYRIIARGNGYTSADRVQDFVLLKAAETTLSAGGNYFVVIDEKDRTNVISGQTPGTMQTNVIGHSAFTTYSPGVNYNIVKPGEALMIRVLRLKPGEAPPPGAFPAQDIANTIGPRLRPQT
jgi:hypothetical protein